MRRKSRKSRKGNIKSFLLGVITAAAATGVITAFAATIDVETGGIRIFWDGEEKTLTDVNGEKVEPMIYNGTTYVPVRAMSELMGKSVEWDDAERAVYVGGKPVGMPVATVNGKEITDVDLNYYVCVAAVEYAQRNGIEAEQLENFDWNQLENGFPVSKAIREEALETAINESLIIQKGAANNIVLDENTKKSIHSEVESLRGAYGDDGFVLRCRGMGIPSILQYEKAYKAARNVQMVESDIKANPSAYFPEDTSVLNFYIRPDRATVKHILISADETNRTEKKKKAEDILKRVQSGEDFDKLAEEFNEDPGASAAGYTFGPGEMVKPFEEASFALSLGGVSGIVETDYGFHIIKRIPGLYELCGYWRAENGNGINISQDMVDGIDVKAMMDDAMAATREVEGGQ